MKDSFVTGFVWTKARLEAPTVNTISSKNFIEREYICVNNLKEFFMESTQGDNSESLKSIASLGGSKVRDYSQINQLTWALK